MLGAGHSPVVSGEPKHLMPGPSVQGVMADGVLSGDGTATCQSPLNLALVGSKVPLKLGSELVEVPFAGDDNGMHESLQVLESSEGTRYSSVLVSGADFGRSGPCSDSGLEVLFESLLGRAVVGPMGQVADGGVGCVLSGGPPLSGLVVGPQCLAAESDSGTVQRGGPPLLGSGVGPLRLEAFGAGLGGLDWARFRVLVTAGQAEFDHSPGPLLVVSLLLWGPTARLSFVPGHNSALPGPTPTTAPIGPLRVRCGGTRPLGPGEDREVVPVQLGGAAALGVFGDSRDDVAENQGDATTAWPGSGAATLRGSSAGVRKSPRLASRRGVHALALAMTRKAAQREDPPRAATGLDVWVDPARSGPASAPASRGGRFQSTHPVANKNVLELSTKCGVLLSEAEADSLTSFMQAAVAKV